MVCLIMILFKLKMACKIKIDKLELHYIETNPDFQKTNNICELCKTSLYHGKQRLITVGKCRHAFHQSCIDEIEKTTVGGIQQKFVSCPLDNVVWDKLYTTKQ